MATPYDKYLNRLRQTKLNSGLSEEYGRQAESMTTMGRYLADKLSGQRMGNASASARAAQQQQALQQVGSTVSGMAGKKMETQANINVQLANQIGQLEMQREQYIKQEEEKKKAKKRGLLQTVGQVGGAVIGGLLALPTGGMSVLAGAGLGSALGGSAGSVIDASAPADYAGVVQGVGDAIRSYGMYSTETKMKDMTSTLANNMGKIASLPSDKIMALTPQIDLMIKTGNMEGLNSLLNGIDVNAINTEYSRGVQLSPLSAEKYSGISDIYVNPLSKYPDYEFNPYPKKKSGFDLIGGK